MKDLSADLHQVPYPVVIIFPCVVKYTLSKFLIFFQHPFHFFHLEPNHVFEIKKMITTKIERKLLCFFFTFQTLFKAGLILNQ